MDAPSSVNRDFPRLDLLGDAIRDQRRALGLTQSQLGERVGWAQERISLLEHGRYGLPSMMGLTRLATGLDLQLADLIAALGLPDDGFGKLATETSTATGVLDTVHRLMRIETMDLTDALNEAATVLAPAMGADKIDVFLLDSATATLVALGSSATPMGVMQRRLGLDRMPLANRTREADVYETGEIYLSGTLERDSHIAPGVIEGMGAHSMLAVPLDIGGERRGVLAALSAQQDRFSDDDIPFFEIAARWVGMMSHRIELMEEVTATATRTARHAATDEFITVVAHDLHNHVTPLKGRLDVLQEKLRRAERTDEWEDVRAAGATVKRLEHLIHDLLDTSRLEEGLFSLDLQVVDAVTLVEAAIESVHSENTPITLDAPDSLMLRADPKQLTRLLENVLINGSRYSPTGVTVTVEQTAGPNDGAEWARITVADQGSGISDDLLPTIFHRFSSGPGSSGLGLGLYLARGIAEAHEGALTVESEPGAGTRFTLSLPVDKT